MSNGFGGGAFFELNDMAPLNTYNLIMSREFEPWPVAVLANDPPSVIVKPLTHHV